LCIQAYPELGAAVASPADTELETALASLDDLGLGVTIYYTQISSLAHGTQQEEQAVEKKTSNQ
jgi:hypothetical protein